jgi:creatinine amidohydrolase
MISRPELVHMDQVGTQSGADLNRLDLPAGVYTGIWWYAKFPNHYGGDAAGANKTLGEFDMKAWAAGVANVIRSVKADQITPRLQNEFYESAKRPLATKQ